ncbi:hypothetical protein APED_33150 [Acanthopleuribacter pedis]
MFSPRTRSSTRTRSILRQPLIRLLRTVPIRIFAGYGSRFGMAGVTVSVAPSLQPIHQHHEMPTDRHTQSPFHPVSHVRCLV